jgi:hypothetical protein
MLAQQELKYYNEYNEKTNDEKQSCVETSLTFRRCSCAQARKLEQK